MKRNIRTNNSAFAPYSQSGRTTFEAAIKSVIFKFQSQHWLVKRQMRQFQNLSFNDFFNLVESQSGLIQLRSDSYRAGLKYRSGPWCNPSLLSAQTLVVSDKHPSIQKTICHVCCPFTFSLCWIAIFAKVAFDKHLSLVTRGCHDGHFRRVVRLP